MRMKKTCFAALLFSEVSLILLFGLILSLQSLSQTALHAFQLQQLKLLPGIFKNAQQTDMNYMLALDVPKTSDSIVVDKDGNKYPLKTLKDGNQWMMANLNLNIANSYCYDDDKKKCEQFGRLYVWESAKQGCESLGNRWRLPTNDELGQLVKLYGGVELDSNASRKGAYKALLISGSSGFNAVLGGGRGPDGQYARGDAHGFYWTGTENGGAAAWFYNFAKGSQALYQQPDGEKERAFSVRCVKSILH